MKFYGLRSCDTCRKALKMLGDAGVSPEVTDVRADGVSRNDLARFYAVHGQALLNTRSTTWRGLDMDERASDPIDLLLRYPTLMKRPVVEGGGRITLGWGADVAKVWLGQLSG